MFHNQDPISRAPDFGADSDVRNRQVKVKVADSGVSNSSPLTVGLGDSVNRVGIK